MVLVTASRESTLFFFTRFNSARSVFIYSSFSEVVFCFFSVFVFLKMKVLTLAIFLSISFAPAFSAHLSDFVKEIEFTQIPGSIEYNFA